MEAFVLALTQIMASLILLLAFAIPAYLIYDKLRYDARHRKQQKLNRQMYTNIEEK